jgi:hypothetical protein
MEVDECGTGNARRQRRHWREMDEEDWKLFDNLTWSTLEKVIEKMPSSSSSSAEVRRRLLLLPVARIIRDAYGMTFRLMRMQSDDPSVEESDLNDLRRLVCRKVEELFNASSDDHQMMAAADDDPPGRRRREEQPAAAAAAAAAPPPPPPPTMP